MDVELLASTLTNLSEIGIRFEIVMKSKQMNVVISCVAFEAVINPGPVSKLGTNACSITTGAIFAIGANVGGVTRKLLFRFDDDVVRS